MGEEPRGSIPGAAEEGRRLPVAIDEEVLGAHATSDSQPLQLPVGELHNLQYSLEFSILEVLGFTNNPAPTV